MARFDDCKAKMHRSRSSEQLISSLKCVAPTLIALTLVLVSATGCVQWSVPESAPSGLTATEGTENDRIILEWNEVANAGVYFVYRSDAENGEYTYLGATSQLSYVDVTMDPEIHYWYVVAAANFLGDIATEKRSDPVLGYSRHDFAWASSSLSFNSSRVRVIADREASGNAFAVTLAGIDGPDGIEVPITVSEYDGAVWQAIGDEFGVANGSVPGSIALGLRSSVPYVAYVDENAGGKITVQKFTVTDGEGRWSTVGNAGRGSVSAGSLSMAVTATQLYVAGVKGPAGSETLEVLSRDVGAGWQTLTSPAAGVPVSSNVVLRIGPDGKLYIAYEDETAAPSSDVQIKRYNSGTGVWDAVSVGDITVDDITSSYFDFDIGASGDIYIAYFIEAAAELHVAAYNGTVWSDITPAGLAADPGAGSVGLSTDGDILYLFYRDEATSRGVVRKRDVSGVWAVVPYSDEEEGITGQYNVSDLRLDAYNNRIFAAFIEGSGASARIYE